MRRTLIPILIVVFALAACNGTKTEPARPDAWTAELRQSKELNGAKLTEETDGPWTVRKAGGGGGRFRGDLAPGAAAAPMADGAWETEGAVGAPPPPGAPARSEAGGGRSGGVAFGGDDHDGGAEPAADPGSPAEAAPGPSIGGPGNASPLKAGTTDDNESYEDFLAFLAEWGDRPDTATEIQLLDVSDRRFVRVVNRDGKPVPAAEVKVVDVAADRVRLLGTTYGDGRVPYYPHLTVGEGPTMPAAEAEPNLLVEVRRGSATARSPWDGKSDLVLAIDEPRPVAEPIALDVLFLIDTTGSMGDEIERIKASLLSMTQKLRGLEREFDLRYAAVLYRDVGDEYVTRAHPFTSDIKAFDAALQSVRADGGGDYAESLNQGLAEAVGRADWRPEAAKVMFLIADAPAHMDYQGDVPYGESLRAAVARGIRIHSVAASGLDDVGSLTFRQVAQFTRGKFIFIEYGSIAASAADHGVKGEVKSNNLDDILFEQIREEVARWGRDV